MNLQVLRKSRVRLQPGDVFAYRIRGHDYGFGRVIRTDCITPGGVGSLVGTLNLIYIYDVFSSVKRAPAILNPRKLMIFPQLINRLPWSHGYFETIEHRTLSPGDVIPHSFYDPIDERFVDENGRTTRKTVPKWHVWAFGSFRTIDVKISLALGMEPAPDTVPPPSVRTRRPTARRRAV